MRMVPIVLKQGSVFQTGRKDVAASRRTMFGTGGFEPYCQWRRLPKSKLLVGFLILFIYQSMEETI
jgi:hypothetical protein